ncbi:PilN domain-containing protein [Roseateles toxinivorans]|uniref:Fimbrial assembly protein PilN n=1 Tax=Roseateles toxinivorans TaxID=270368 RepID=A0A4R6QUF4_9BURK|nr:PilN domain-containing protein [Roseateles toxinivorans]TDP74986.1 fimbrial assembly protein PilN [Roseateles toxinivorans]
MAQQINLLTPILLAPKRYFSATAMAQALGLLLAGALLISAWLLWQSRQTRQSYQQIQAEANNERQVLMDALMRLPGSTDPAALNQQLGALQQGLLQRRQMIDELGRGRALPGQSHSDLLRLLARTVPPPVWLTELRWTSGRLELQGLTLEPPALQPWVQQLAAHPLLRGQQLATVKVERIESGGPDGTLAAGSEAGPALRGAARPRWRFTLVSASTPVPAPSKASAP